MTLLVLGAACSRSEAPPEAPGDASVDLSQVDAILAGRVPLPSRAAARVLASQVGLAAANEAGSARGAELSDTAARISEMTWRTYHERPDGEQAVLALRQTAEVGPLGARCDRARRAALIDAELAPDLAKTYKDLYAIRVRLRPASGAAGGALPERYAECLRSVDRDLALISVHRPPARELEAVRAAAEKARSETPSPQPGAHGQGDAPVQIDRLDPLWGVDSARIVVTLTGPARFKVTDQPARSSGQLPTTTVELYGVGKGPVKDTLRGKGVIRSVRIDHAVTGERVVLEVARHAYRRVFHLLEPYRVVIDVASKPPAGAKARRRVRRIALDPGHGGHDPGAIGPTGIREKDVTLSIAQRTKKLLEKAGLQVLMTRDNDATVKLEERTAKANAADADLFVSLHCNAAEVAVATGVETWWLDAANDKVAARLAARENATSQAAQDALADLIRKAHVGYQVEASRDFAGLVQRGVMASVRPAWAKVHDGGIHQAGFYVLVGARMPGVLLETGYISNPHEEKKLADATYQQVIAEGIVNAVRAYRAGRTVATPTRR